MADDADRWLAQKKAEDPEHFKLVAKRYPVLPAARLQAWATREVPVFSPGDDDDDVAWPRLEGLAQQLHFKRTGPIRMRRSTQGSWTAGIGSTNSIPRTCVNLARVVPDLSRSSRGQR